MPVDERIDARGEVVRPLDPADAERAVRRLLDQGVEALAVCLLNCFANPAHEQMIKQAALRLAPDLPISISSEVLPEIKEYERTSSTVINAYLTPIVGRYLARLEGDLDGQGRAGAAPDHAVERRPDERRGGGAQAHAHRRIRACRRRGRRPGAGRAPAGIDHLISFDMGGTTAKAGIIERGEFSRALEYQVGGGIMTGSRLLTGAGYLLKVPAIDLAEVGAGGGSIVRIDAGGSMIVGPDSAGAVPGPVCYDTGGDEPTVTDASLILGHLNPDFLVGGALKLNAERARTMFAERIARPLGLSLEHAAYGAQRIASANMMRAIRAVSIERGRDPRDYALCAFGGNGPVFACTMAKELGMRRVLVPPSPGLFSAFGLLYAEVEHHYGAHLPPPAAQPRPRRT